MLCQNRWNGIMIYATCTGTLPSHLSWKFLCTSAGNMTGWNPWCDIVHPLQFLIRGANLPTTQLLLGGTMNYWLGPQFFAGQNTLTSQSQANPINTRMALSRQRGGLGCMVGRRFCLGEVLTHDVINKEFQSLKQ